MSVEMKKTTLNGVLEVKGKNSIMKKVADMYLLLDIVDYVPGVVRGSYRWSSLGCSVSTAHTKWGSFQDI